MNVNKIRTPTRLPRKKQIARNKKIVALYKNGISIPEIVKKTGLGYQPIIYVLKVAGVPIINKQKKEKFEKIMKFYKQGYKIKEIAGFMNFTSEYIRQILRKVTKSKARIYIPNTDENKIKNNMRRDILSGLTLKELSKKYGYTIITIKTKIVRYKLPTPHSIAIKKRNKGIVADIKNGIDIEIVVHKYNVKRGNVFQICMKHGFSFEKNRRKRIEELSNAGYSTENIAKEIKLGVKAIQYHVRQIKKKNL